MTSDLGPRGRGREKLEAFGPTVLCRSRGGRHIIFYPTLKVRSWAARGGGVGGGLPSGDKGLEPGPVLGCMGHRGCAGDEAADTSLSAVCADAAGPGQGAGRRAVHLGAGPGPGLLLRPALGPALGRPFSAMDSRTWKIQTVLCLPGHVYCSPCVGPLLGIAMRRDSPGQAPGGQLPPQGAGLRLLRAASGSNGSGGLRMTQLPDPDSWQGRSHHVTLGVTANKPPSSPAPRVSGHCRNPLGDARRGPHWQLDPGARWCRQLWSLWNASALASPSTCRTAALPRLNTGGAFGLRRWRIAVPSLGAGHGAGTAG